MERHAVTTVDGREVLFYREPVSSSNNRLTKKELTHGSLPRTRNLTAVDSLSTGVPSVNPAARREEGKIGPSGGLTISHTFGLTARFFPS